MPGRRVALCGTGGSLALDREGMGGGGLVGMGAATGMALPKSLLLVLVLTGKRPPVLRLVGRGVSTLSSLDTRSVTRPIRYIMP